jgi:hypothetical protein
MQNKIIMLILAILAVANLFVLSWFSVFNAIVSTSMGLFFSFSWFFIVGKVLADKNTSDGVERLLSFKESLLLIGPGAIYYLTVCGVAVSVYIYT